MKGLKGQLSAARSALCIDVEGVERLAGGHEQPIALATAETNVGATLWQSDVADGSAIRREHPHTMIDPMPQPHHRLPSMSTRKPSGVASGPASIKVRLFEMVRPF